MRDEILVTVLCTAYNHEAYLRTCLEGLVHQETDFGYEILISDDASTDGTAAIIREYEARYPERIRPFYFEENIFSRGINVYDAYFFPAARGKYTAICEGDDYWTDPTKLQRQVDFLEAHPKYTACVHDTLVHSCDGGKPDYRLLRHGADCDVQFEDVLFGMSHAFHTSSILARKEIIAHPADFFYVGLAHGFGDQPDGLWLITNGRVRYLDRCMSVYRIHSNNAAWSSAVDGTYGKMLEFFEGKLALLRAYRPYAQPERVPAVDQAILETEFEKMHFEGRDREQRLPPYAAILRRQSLGYRAKNLIKCCFPHLHRAFRRYRHYGENG